MRKDASKPRVILIVGAEHVEDAIWRRDVGQRVFGQFDVFAEAVDFFPGLSLGVAEGVGPDAHDGAVLGVEVGMPDVDLAG